MAKNNRAQGFFYSASARPARECACGAVAKPLRTARAAIVLGVIQMGTTMSNDTTRIFERDASGVHQGDRR